MGRRCFERAKVRPRSWYLFFKGWKRDRVRDWRQRYSVRGEGGGEGHIVAMVREGSPVVNHWPIIHEISPGSSAKTYFCLRAQSLKGGGGRRGHSLLACKTRILLTSQQFLALACWSSFRLLSHVARAGCCAHQTKRSNNRVCSYHKNGQWWSLRVDAENIQSSQRFFF